MQGQLVILKLPYGQNKFRSMLIKSHFINKTSNNDNEPIPENFVPTSIQAPAIDKPTIKEGLAEFPPIERLYIYVPATSTSLTSLTIVKSGRGQSRNYPE